VQIKALFCCFSSAWSWCCCLLVGTGEASECCVCSNCAMTNKGTISGGPIHFRSNYFLSLPTAGSGALGGISLGKAGQCGPHISLLPRRLEQRPLLLPAPCTGLSDQNWASAKAHLKPSCFWPPWVWCRSRLAAGSLHTSQSEFCVQEDFCSVPALHPLALWQQWCCLSNCLRWTGMSLC